MKLVISPVGTDDSGTQAPQVIIDLGFPQGWSLSGDSSIDSDMLGVFLQDVDIDRAIALGYRTIDIADIIEAL